MARNPSQEILDITTKKIAKSLKRKKMLVIRVSEIRCCKKCTSGEYNDTVLCIYCLEGCKYKVGCVENDNSLYTKCTYRLAKVQEGNVVDVQLLKGTGIKYDKDKPRWDLLPYEQLGKVVEVYTKGAIKYEDYNWQKLANPEERWFSAIMRHLTAWKQGNKNNDEDWGLPHLAHAIFGCLALMWVDDQPKQEKEEDSK